jgi:GH24 family phage-related lysozyme (muramidase)
VNLSAKGAAFIGAFEGFRAECYDDAAGNCTIGYGHLIHTGPTTAADRAKWGTISRTRAAQLLQADAAHAAAAVRDHVHVPLRQGQFDALVSLAYNCGPGVIPGVADVINTRPRYLYPKPTEDGLAAYRSRVQSTLVAYDHAGGQVLAGLKRRRQAEFVLFDTGHYTKAAGNGYANA